jgi:hypothetical protein
MAKLTTELPLNDDPCDCAPCRFAAILEGPAVQMYSALGISAGEAGGGMSKLATRLVLVQAFQERHGPIERFSEAEAGKLMDEQVITRAIELLDALHVINTRKLKRALVELAGVKTLEEMPIRTRTM